MTQYEVVVRFKEGTTKQEVVEVLDFIVSRCGKS